MRAAPATVAVHAWPQQRALAVRALGSGSGLAVIGIATPVPHDRQLARQLVRDALRQLLGQFLDQPAAALALVSQPGQAVALNFPGSQLRLSVSHMPGLSVAAVSNRFAVGVDVMAVDGLASDMPDWAQVALDYLGPVQAALLHRTVPAGRPAAFARAWTRHEAGLKCCRRALTEWTPALANLLASCQEMALSLPDGCCGTVAIGWPVAGQTVNSPTN